MRLHTTIRETVRPAVLLPSLFLLLTLLVVPPAVAAEGDGSEMWTDINVSPSKDADVRAFVPRTYRTVRLDVEAMALALSAAPPEVDTDLVKSQGAVGALVSLPLPEGGFESFHLVESPIMEPDLARRYPEIRTYRGWTEDGTSSVRLDLTPAGFHAMIRSPRGSVYVDPWKDAAQGSDGIDVYLTYRASEARAGDRIFACGVTEGHDTSDLVRRYREERRAESAGASKGSPEGSEIMLRTYRLALAATGEYTAFHGGTVPLGMAAIVTAMNRVNGIYEEEVAIRMVLVANNDLLVYTDGATDPYTNDNGSAMLSENQANVDAVIGNANYDIGHVFSTGGGGIASLGVPCRSGLKARGVTGLGAPTGDPFWVDYVAHEMGHQWAGNHTFNGDDGSCSGGNRNGPTAYEPGSGSTIQAYAGICGSQNLQSNSDAYFHGISLDEIISYSRVGNGNTCAVQSGTGNEPPTVAAGADFTIPLSTPFELCGSGSDPDLDAVTFAWEEFDLGPAGAPDQPVGDAPIFRSFSPTSSPCRTFPRLSDLAAGTVVIGELLPSYARTMNFRLTARDSQSGGGGVADDANVVTVTDAAGPFVVTAPNSAVSLAEGSMTTVTWDVASTDQAPVNCGTVDISLSSDGGLAYPTVLAAAVANSGSQSVTLPAMATANARVQVRCASNIFFDISDVDFGIGVPLVSISSPLDGATFVSGDPVTFTGSATDPEDGDLSASLSWTSSLAGAIGSGASFQLTDLELGTHVITAAVTDSDTNTGEASVTIYVEPECFTLQYSAGYETDDDGWVEGLSSCTTGNFIRGTPDEVIDGGIITQPDGAATGTFAWFTANNGGGVGTDDVDGGTCETLSPVVNVGAGSQVTAFVEHFHGQRDQGDDSQDGFTIELVEGNTGVVLATLVNIGDVTHEAVWTTAWKQIDSSPETVRLVVSATDGEAGGDLVEGGVDDIRICVGPTDLIFEDGFESGSTSAWSNTFP